MSATSISSVERVGTDICPLLQNFLGNLLNVRVIVLWGICKEYTLITDRKTIHSAEMTEGVSRS